LSAALATLLATVAGSGKLLGAARLTVSPTKRAAVGRRSAPLWIACGLAAAGLGCSGAQAAAANPTHPIAESRAIEVIRQAMIAYGAEPAPGRQLTLANGSVLQVDVGVQDHQFGIAYVTSADAQALGTGIPPPNRKDERLRLARGGSDGEVRVVLLYQENYLYDDLAGEAHTLTAIASERSLARDVQDFITHARSQKYR
jgi:hypothetical protein